MKTWKYYYVTYDALTESKKKKKKKKIVPSCLHAKSEPGPGYIQINNNAKTLVMAKEQYGFSKRSEEK